MFDHIGVPELLLILLIVFIFFGAGKLPQVGAQFGKAIRSFKKSQLTDDEEEAKPVMKADSKQAKPTDETD